MKKQNKQLPEYNFGSIQVVVKDQMQDEINLEHIFNKINILVPNHFLDLIDIIYIGQFDFFKKREINALFLDDALYISNEQDDNEDLLDDIIHELAHAAEKKYGNYIYGDGKLENEFLLKRKQLKRILQNQEYDIEKYNFFETEYNKEFDFFLYKEVGYDTLRILSVNLFVDPYSPTSLQEYFAAGFEQFYLGDKRFLKELSPYIYSKLKGDIEDEYQY